jgi:hypothetical protein
MLATVMLFYFLKLWPGQSMTDKEACRNSVMLRSPDLLDAKPQNSLVPLKCKTENIEITSQDPTKIKKRIAESMYDCWWMLGEGKVRFWTEGAAKSFGLGNIKSTCVICSTISFSDKLKKKNMNLDIATYLSETKIPLKNMTFLEYFTEEEGTRLPTDVDLVPIRTDQEYAVVFMGMESDELWEPIVKDLGIVLSGLGGTALVANSVGGPKAVGSLFKWGGGILGKGFTFGTKSAQLAAQGYQGWTTTAAGSGFASGAGAQIGGFTAKLGWIGAIIAVAFMATQTIWTANNQAIAAQRCDGSKKGCMQVMLIPFEANQIATMCNNIESIP